MVRFLGIPILFCLATLAVWLLATWKDEAEEALVSTRIHWTFPTQVDNVTEVASELHRYKQKHYAYVLTLFVAAYLYKQAFAIPGSFFLVRPSPLHQSPVIGLTSC